jgi:bacterioferritin-associated ferredoxin
MYVCICNAVTDSEIRACANEGARTLADLRERLRVATGCCRCASMARALLREHRESDATLDCAMVSSG